MTAIFCGSLIREPLTQNLLNGSTRRLTDRSLSHGLMLRSSGSVILPNVFECFRECLQPDRAIDVKSVACKYELVMVALCGEHPGHVLIGENPVVHAIPHYVGIEKVAIANFHPEADRLSRTVRDEVFVEFPGAMRSFRIVGPLLIDEGA